MDAPGFSRFELAHVGRIVMTKHTDIIAIVQVKRLTLLVRQLYAILLIWKICPLSSYAGIYQSSFIAQRRQPAYIIMVERIVLPQVRAYSIGHAGHQERLRISAQIGLRTHAADKRFHFLIVESKVHIAQGGAVSHLSRIDKTHIIEIPPGFAHAILIISESTLCSRQRIVHRQHQVVAPIDAYTSGIDAYGRNVAAQSAQSTAHTNKTSRTAQVFGSYIHAIIYRLCHCRCRQTGGKCNQYHSFLHVQSINYIKHPRLSSPAGTSTSAARTCRAASRGITSATRTCAARRV